MKEGRKGGRVTQATLMDGFVILIVGVHIS